jgi:2-keto-4-pentenoate hydratase/2-oxohepta-3-ene-1,7-dioic acid hydratase in catechol pathway
MRLLSFIIETPLGREVRVGARHGDGSVLDLTLATASMLIRRSDLGHDAARRVATALVPPRMLAFVENGAVALDKAQEVLEWAEKSGDGPPPATGMTALPVLPDPPLLRDFMAFETHLRSIYPRLGREIPPEWYNFPVYYKGNPASLGADGDDVRIPDYCRNFDFEFEFAAVIGKGGADIPRERAMDHIYGFTIYNDFSARDFQAREMSVGLGPAKGKDFHKGHVIGPVLVTRDEIPDVYALDMRATVGGAEWCRSSTGTMHWRFEDMIAHASRNETLRVGEIFGSGTVGGGSAAEFGKSLGRGDDVELTVERIGTLRNRVV